MRAARVMRLEGPDAIEVSEIDEPGGDGVVVDVHAAGVAFPDALLSRGLYQYKLEPPFVVGAEIAGVVRSAPTDSQVQPGDRVVGLTMIGGAMAETAILDPQRVFKLPDNVSFEAGAGLLFNDLTVFFALSVRGRLQQGETVLVQGAAGGIGTSTLRIAPVLGASRTIAVVGTQDKAEIATAAGATDVVLADGFKDAVKELTDGRGVDIVMDPVGGDRFTDSLRSPGTGGTAAGGRLHRRRDPHRQGEPVVAQQRRRGGRRLGSMGSDASGRSGRAVGLARTVARLGPAAGTRPRGVSARGGRRGGGVVGEPHRQGQSGGAGPGLRRSYQLGDRRRCGEPQAVVGDRSVAQHLDISPEVHHHLPRTTVALTRQLVDGALDVAGVEVQQRPGGHVRIAEFRVAGVVAMGVHVGQQPAEVLAQRADLQRP